jgi:endonuclease I
MKKYKIMKKIYSILSLLSISLILAQAGKPETPYYDNFSSNWTLTGTALKNALASKITTTHTNILSYGWEALQVSDLDPNNSNNVLLIYGWENGTDGDVTNDLFRSKNSNSGSNGDWNREHTYAKSLGNPDLGTSGPGADAHNLRASDVQRNNSRGSLKFATGTGNSGSVSGGWYPGDQWKGDVARMMMYMYLRYGNQCLPTGVGTGTTVTNDTNMLNLFLQWNAEDPVSQYEDNRNTYLGNTANTYAQGNRNPFIDNPYLATVIWGGPIAQNRWPNIFLGNNIFEFANIYIYPNPSSNHKINIDSSIKLDDLQLINLNGQLLMDVKNPVFNNNSYTIENLPQGFYFLKLSSNNNSITKKISVN